MTAQIIGPGGSISVTGEVEVKNDAGNPIPVSIPAGAPVSITGAVEVNNDSGDPLRAKDTMIAGEALADQNGAAGVLTFVFSSAVQLVWVRSKGGISRADPFGGIPAINTGIPCADDEPTPISVQTASVKVWAPAGSVVSVWGFRY